MRSVADDYRAGGFDFARAYKLLAQGCEIPPSFEVFEHELKVRQKERPNLTPEVLARRLVDNYHRVPGLFRD